MDPTFEEEMLCKSFFKDMTSEMGIISLSYMPTHGQVTEITQTGAVDTNRLLNSMDLLVSKCKEISVLSQQHLVENVKQRLAKGSDDDTGQSVKS